MHVFGLCRSKSPQRKTIRDLEISGFYCITPHDYRSLLRGKMGPKSIPRKGRVPSLALLSRYCIQKHPELVPWSWFLIDPDIPHLNSYFERMIKNPTRAAQNMQGHEIMEPKSVRII